jgi:hypothetical protein
VRKAFTADVGAGRTLVVADYGQLELRILAHMAGCTSMVRAFEAGGDFHSRTALGMYDHIQEAIAQERCLLEWEGEGEAPLPLLKDMFAVERRKAKVLNFSIAYGKTAHGLSRDWKVSLEEAQETVKRWYADRPEVRGGVGAGTPVGGGHGTGVVGAARLVQAPTRAAWACTPMQATTRRWPALTLDPAADARRWRRGRRASVRRRRRRAL